MPRPRTKEDLMIATKENYDKLNVLIAKLSDEELNTPLDFSSDKKKERGSLEKRQKFKRYFDSFIWMAPTSFELGRYKFKGSGKTFYSSSI